MNRLGLVSSLILLFAAAAYADEREVSVTAGDGFALQGNYYSAEKGGPGILLLHQCNADRRIYDQLATMLNVAGYNVLAIDWRGFGGSRAGAFTDFQAQRQKI
jgi:predicted alpha/beta hydrolase